MSKKLGKYSRSIPVASQFDVRTYYLMIELTFKMKIIKFLLTLSGHQERVCFVQPLYCFLNFLRLQRNGLKDFSLMRENEEVLVRMVQESSFEQRITSLNLVLITVYAYSFKTKLVNKIDYVILNNLFVPYIFPN